MDVAVIGGGLYGVTVALQLDEAGYNVDLYEQADDIMTAASWANQWRLHQGYHYPRSASTATSCKISSDLFAERFSDAIIESSEHYYCIAKEQTKTTGDEFITHCEDIGLEYECSQPNIINSEIIDLSIKVPENRIDPHLLKQKCKTELAESNINLHLNERIEDLDKLPHVYKIVATYAGINTLFESDEPLRGRYKFELIEKPVVELPDQFDETSVVVMDGPFMCFDPYGYTGNFLLGNVIHAIHETTVGERPNFSDRYDELLNAGVIESPSVTKFDEFINSGKKFIPGLNEAKHIGSLYTIRTVLADVEDTDKRPTIVERDGDTFKVFSGKLASSVLAARNIVAEIEEEVRKTDIHF